MKQKTSRIKFNSEPNLSESLNLIWAFFVAHHDDPNENYCFAFTCFSTNFGLSSKKKISKQSNCVINRHRVRCDCCVRVLRVWRLRHYTRTPIQQWTLFMHTVNETDFNVHTHTHTIRIYSLLYAPFVLRSTACSHSHTQTNLIYYHMQNVYCTNHFDRKCLKFCCRSANHCYLGTADCVLYFGYCYYCNI